MTMPRTAKPIRWHYYAVTHRQRITDRILLTIAALALLILGAFVTLLIDDTALLCYCATALRD